MPTQSKGHKPSFIEEARRKQLIEAAIVTIAERGYVNTSLADIAEQVEVSKGVISYYFDRKDDLIDATLTEILSAQSSHIKAQVDKQETAAGKLRAYIQASFDYMKDNRTRQTAQVDLWGSFTSVEEKKQFNATAYDPCREDIQKILRAGQRSGEFRAFDVKSLSAVIQAAIDGVMLQWVFDADEVDLDQCCREVIEMVERHTRKE